MKNLWDRTGASEEHISTVYNTLAPLATTVREAFSELTALLAKVHDLENRSCHNNLRFIEKSEGTDPEHFLFTWCRKSLPPLTSYPYALLQQVLYQGLL